MPATQQANAFFFSRHQLISRVQRVLADAELRRQLVRGPFANLKFDGITDADLIKGPGLGNRSQELRCGHA